jgi:uncharacterized membrane protein
MAIAAAAAYSAISLYRHNLFGSTIDLATQGQTVWGYSHFQIVPNTVIGIPNLMGDHFNPILMVLAPLFWIWNSAAVLLVAQAVLLAIAGVPIFMWGAQRLGVVAGLAFQGAYYVYWGILAGVLFDFHHVAFAVPAMAWALYATVNRRNWLLAAMVVVAMLTREDVALTLVALGFYILVVQRRFVLGAAVMLINIVWFLLLLGVIMPALAGIPYRHWTYTALGDSPSHAALNIARNPLKAIELMFVPLAKTRIWIGSLGSWLFLPLLSPLTIVALPSFLERFWNDGPDFWTFHMQYSMLSAPILAFASIDGVARVIAWRRARSASPFGIRAALAVLAASAVLSVAVNPLAELSTYVLPDTAADIQTCLDTIPPTAGVAATQNLLPHLATRTRIYTIPAQVRDRVFVSPIDLGVDYIAIDIATEGNDSQFRDVVRAAFNAGYGVECTRELTVVLKKGSNVQSLTPQLDRWLAGQCAGRACLSASG